MIHMIFRKIHIFLLDFPFRKQKYKFCKTDVKEESIILLVHDLYKNGAEILALNIARQLSYMGVNVCILALRPGPLYEEFCKNSTVCITNERDLRNIILWLSKEKKCNKVICNTVISGSHSSIFREHNFTIVTLIHEMEKGIRGYFGKSYNRKCDEIVEYSDILIFPSKYVKNSFFKCIRQNNVVFDIHDQGFYFQNKMNTEKNIPKWISNKFKIPQDAKIVINIAVASYRKGFDIFLDIVNAVNKIDKKIYFIWIGSGTYKIFKQKERMYGKNSLKNLRLPGYIDDVCDLNTINYQADLLFLTSREDAFPAVVLNSFAMGTPVFAFDGCGGFADIIHNEKTGYLFSSYDLDIIRKKIIGTVYNDRLLHQMGENCVEEAKRHSFVSYCNYLMELLNTKMR